MNWRRLACGWLLIGFFMAIQANIVSAAHVGWRYRPVDRGVGRVAEETVGAFSDPVSDEGGRARPVRLVTGQARGFGEMFGRVYLRVRRGTGNQVSVAQLTHLPVFIHQYRQFVVKDVGL
jgi:hypothetical protein